MQFEICLRKLAKSSYWQNIYKSSKESNIFLFENQCNYSGLQHLFLYWLHVYSLLEKELAEKSWENLNRNVLDDLILLPENTHSDFAVDTLWILQMALKGELIRVPEVLYHKRLLSGSASQMRIEDKLNAWFEHCKDCSKIILREGFEREELILLLQSAKSRLSGSNYPLWGYREFLNIGKDQQDLLIKNLEKSINTLDTIENKPKRNS